MDKWTVETVETRLEDAAQVIRRLPPVRVPGYFNTWPSMFVEFADLVGQEPAPMRLPPPSTAAITRMEETLGWLRWLEAEDVKLVWARADRTPWKAICCRFGDQPRDCEPAIPVCAEPDCVAAQWTHSAGEMLARLSAKRSEHRLKCVALRQAI